MKVLVFTLMALAFASGAPNDEAPVFTPLQSVSQECTLNVDEIIVVASAMAGTSAIEYQLEVNSAYQDVFEIDDISGTVVVSKDVNYCNNLNQPFGMKIIAKNVKNGKTSSIDVNITLEAASLPINFVGNPDA